MSEANPTPGPWGWEYHPRMKTRVIALSASKTDVLLCTGDDEASWGNVTEANARLIAAAPDLLAACCDAFDFIVAKSDPHKGYDSKITRQLSAAIVKATGGAS